MIILQINKYFYPRGGADAVMLDLSHLLEQHGHHIISFAMQSEKNLDSPFSHAFVNEVETEKVKIGWQGLHTAGRMIYSWQVRKKISSLIKTTKPELAHIHNIYHQISPSILGVLQKADIPIIMTIHDWNLLAPNYTLFDHGEICEKRGWASFINKCTKDSYLASALDAFVFWLHQSLGLYRRNIKHFIAPSQFVKDKHIEAGFDEKNITVIPHFFDASKITPSSETGDYVGFIGRLSPEKGLLVFIEAAKKLPEVMFKIAGIGPEEEKLKELVETLGLRNVEFVGRLDGVMRDRFYRNAMCVVVPSVWYEPFGLVVLESCAAGTPVIASRIGALPELVKENQTGFLFEPGNSAELAKMISLLVEDVGMRRAMGATARRIVETEYTPELHYERLMKVYKKIQ